MSETVDVRFLGFPVALWKRASAHHEAVQREFDIMRASHTPDSVPHRLLRLVEQNQVRFGDLGEAFRADLEDALGKGVQSVDVTLTVPVEVKEAAAGLDAMLDEVDEFCRAGEHLLTLAGAPDVVAFRRWALGELVRQVDGEPPLRWEDFAGPAAPPTPAGADAPVETADPTGEVVIAFRQDLDLSTAGELRDALQELKREEAVRVVLDLREVELVDSVGLSLLVTSKQRFTEEGRELRLRVNPFTARLIQLSGLADLLDAETVSDVSA